MDQSWRTTNPFGRLREYELKHFVQDLEERGPHDKLHRVFLLEDSEGRNAWYEAKNAIGAGQAYLSDLERAWGVLKQENRQRVVDGRAPDLAAEFRYALTASVLSSGTSRPPWLVVELARCGVWTPEEAVTFALRDRDWSRRVVALTMLCDVLDGDWKLAAQKSALGTIGDGPGETPNRTAISVDPDDKSASISELRCAAECLVQLVPSLAEALIPGALETARKAGGLWRYHSLKAVLPRLPDAQREAEAELLWQSAGKYRATYWKAEAMAIAASVSFGEPRQVRMAEAVRIAVDVLGDEEARKYRLEDPLTGALLIGSSVLLIRREDLRPLRELAPHLSLDEWKVAEGRIAALPEEMRDAARSVLLPELARLGAAADSAAAIGRMTSGYFRGLARATYLEYSTAKANVLQGWLAETESIEDADERTMCRAALARAAGVRTRAAVITSVIEEVEKLEAEMHLPALLDLAPAFRNLPARERVPLAAQALALAGKGTRQQMISADFVGCALAPHLDRDAVVEWYRSERGVELGHSREEIEAKLRAAVAAKAMSIGPESAGVMPVAKVAEALKRTTALPFAAHARAIALASQFAGESELEVLAQAAALIRQEYERLFAEFALTQRAEGPQRKRFATVLLQTLLRVKGGLTGAEPYVQSVVADLGGTQSQTYEECSLFAAALSRESIGTALEELGPVAAVLQLLGGPQVLDGVGEAIGLVDRWWGKRAGPGAEPKTETEKSEWRFQWKGLPATPQESALELLTTLTRGREFDAAGEVLAAIRAAGWAATAQTGWNALVAECAAAGELDRCAALLKDAKSVSGEAAALVARAYIRYGRREEALTLLSGESAWPAAFQIIESLGAEEEWSDALKLFTQMTADYVPEDAWEHFVNACFVVGNGAFKTKDAHLLDGFLKALGQVWFAEEVAQKVRARLTKYADDLAKRGNIGRADAWRHVAGMFHPG